MSPTSIIWSGLCNSAVKTPDLQIEVTGLDLCFTHWETCDTLFVSRLQYRYFIL